MHMVQHKESSNENCHFNFNIHLLSVHEHHGGFDGPGCRISSDQSGRSAICVPGWKNDLGNHELPSLSRKDGHDSHLVLRKFTESIQSSFESFIAKFVRWDHLWSNFFYSFVYSHNVEKMEQIRGHEMTKPIRKPLGIDLKWTNNDLHISLLGPINEDTNLDEILHSVQQKKEHLGTAFFDLSRITDVNSCGIRVWIFFIEKIQTQMKCVFTIVNEIFVTQAAIIPNLFGKLNNPVISILAPYFCSHCNQSFSKTLKTEELFSRKNRYIAPRYNCEKCHSLLEFDEIEEEFFNFLTNRLE